VPSSTAVFAQSTTPFLRVQRGYTAARSPKLIDTRLVRVELARLRAPRAATEIPRARVSGSTIAGA